MAPAAMDDDQAAVTIQAAYRGHRARKQHSTSQNMPEEPVAEMEEEQAAPMDAPVATPPKGMDDEQAATTIQAAYRGHRSRKAQSTAEPVAEKAPPAMTEETLQPPPKEKKTGRRSPKSPRSRKSDMPSSPSPSTSSRRANPVGQEAGKRLANHGASIYHITMYINGNSRFPGRDVMVDSRQTRSFDLFLDKMTKVLDPPFGTVHKVFSVDGAPITKFDDFEENGSYVAASRGFKKIKYTSIKSIKEKEESYTAPDLSYVKKPKAEKARFLPDEKPLQIFVLPNGDEDGAGAKLLFSKKDMPSWEKVLERITKKFQMRLEHGAVKRLVTLDGKEINGLDQLENGGVYVAVDRGTLKMPPFTLGPDGSLVRKPKKRVPFTMKPVVHAKPRQPRNFNNRFDELHQARQQHKERKQKARSSNPIGKITSRAQAVAAIESIYNQLLESHMESDEVSATLDDMARSVRTISYNHKQESPDATDVFDERIEEVLSYMMQTEEAGSKTPAEIKERFEPMVQAALAGRLPHWESQAAAFTALVILLDQFPRSLYRGTPRMYSGDAMCRDVVVRAIFDTSVMDEVHPVYRLFPCLALTHQEDVEMQKLCVSEWARATAYFEENDPIREYGNTFKSNFEIMQEFGRFPDRNNLLGRESTPKELEYLGVATDTKKKSKKGKKRREFGSMHVPLPGH